MAEEAKPNTSVQKPPEGTPAGGAGDEQGKEKLYAGKYKTIEDWEKGTKELEEKLRTQGQEKNTALEEKVASDKKLEGMLDQQKKVAEAQTEEQRKVEGEKLKALGTEFSERFKKGPEEMMRAFDDLIRTHPSVTGALRRTDIEAQQTESLRQQNLFNKVAAKHKDDWEGLKSKMGEIWNGLSPATRAKPDEKLMETVYKAAKAEVMPTLEQLQKAAAEKEKAGSGQGVGTGEKVTVKTDRVDAILAQREKDNTMGNLLK